MNAPQPAPALAQPALTPPAPSLTVEQLQALPATERAQLEALIASSEAYLWAPSPGPQALAYHSPADELFYGGAAGGGKSQLILGLALTRHRRSLILRRESTQLRGMLDDIAKLLKTRDGLNNQTGQWRLPRALARFPDQLIEFGGVPNPGDEERHQGIAHDLLAFDEVTQMSEYIIDYLTTWCRTTVPGQRTRVVLASNPPTPSTQYAAAKASGGGLWLIRRYAPWLDPQYRDPYNLGPAQPGELRYFVSLDGREQEWPDPMPFRHHSDSNPPRSEVITPTSRTFIPSLPTDNPYLGSAYIATLQKRPEPLRSALLYGDFSVSLTDQPFALFPADWIRASTQRHLEQTHAIPSPVHNSPMTAIGVDVARGGSDSTVIQPRYSTYYPQPILVPAALARTGPEVAAEVLKVRRDQAALVIDANGVGASVYDHLTGNTSLDEVYAYVGSTRATLRDSSGNYSFTNLRSQSYWRLREALDPASPAQIAIPDDPELINELLAHTWEEVSGKIKVIPKQDVAKALGRSPDKADALVLAHSAIDEEADSTIASRSAREARLADARNPGGQAPALGRRGASADAWDPSRPLAAVIDYSSRRKARWKDRDLPYPRRY